MVAEKAKKRQEAHESAAARYRAKSKQQHPSLVKKEPLSATEAEVEEYKSSSVRAVPPSRGS